MLSRTADHMYWMSRYIERAESLARLVDAHYRMSLLPHSGETLAQSLSSTMAALQMEAAYKERHDAIEPRAVFEFVSLDRDYGGSIFSCLRIARENARAVRGALTSELWETLNSTWLEARSLATRRGSNPDIGQFVEWVKERSHLTRGVTVGTTNLYLAEGPADPKDLIGSVKQGLYVTELIGFGVNGVTGDYSRGAVGMWIDNGELAYPVEEITIAGNLLDMFRAIEGVGNDLVFRDRTAAPTLLVGRMTVAGA